MKEFTVWMSQTDTYKIFFEAETIQQAKELLEKVNEGEISFEELPNVTDKLKNVEIEVAIDTLDWADEQ